MEMMVAMVRVIVRIMAVRQSKGAEAENGYDDDDHHGEDEHCDDANDDLHVNPRLSAGSASMLHLITTV